MDGREFSRHFTREAKKRGITPIPGRDTTTAEYAERVRSDKIELYRRLIREGNYREEFEGNEYNLRAYQMMTPQEILMSENIGFYFGIKKISRRFKKNNNLCRLKYISKYRFLFII